MRITRRGRALASPIRKSRCIFTTAHRPRHALRLQMRNFEKICLAPRRSGPPPDGRSRSRAGEGFSPNDTVLVRMGNRGFTATSRFGKRVEELKGGIVDKYDGWMRVVEMRMLHFLGTPVGYSTCVTSVTGSECVWGPFVWECARR